jgi:hypothetical protein
MDKEKIDKLVKLRGFLIESHNGLDGGTNPKLAMMRQQDVATMLTSAIKRIDSILSEYVNFE